MKKVIILGAGKPHAGSSPAIFFKQNKYFNNFDVIKKIFSNYTKNITLVTGYNHREIIKNIKTRIVYNSQWNKTKSLYSLFCTNFESCDEIIIVYSDIIFNENILKDLIKSDKDISIVVSSKNIIYKKGKEYLYRKKKKILNLGSNLKKNQINTEFIGLVKIKRRGIKFLEKIKKNKKKFNKLQISDLIKILIKNNFDYELIDIKNDWKEIDNNSNEIRKHILNTKANTLAFAGRYLKKSKVLPQFTFSIKDWKLKPLSIIRKIKKFSNIIIIRSSSLDEDNFQTSGAGKFLSYDNISTKVKFNDKIEKVISSFQSSNLDNQVLIQPNAKNIICNGVVFTNKLENNFPTYIINLDFKKNDTSSITSGKSNNHKTFVISKYNLNIKNVSNIYIKKILEASKEIEELFLQESLDIEFALTKKKKFVLFQVRPIILNKKNEIEKKVYDKTYEANFNKWKKNYKNLRYKNFLTPLLGLMPDWNPAEIIGFKPKPLPYSIYEELITNKIWAKQREEFGYKKISKPKLLIDFFGTPYVNVNKTFHSFIPKKINSSLEKKLLLFYNHLLINNRDLHDKIEFNIVQSCLTSNFINVKKKFIKNNFSEKEINYLENELRKINFNIEKILDLNLKKIKILNQNYDRLLNKKLSDVNLIKSLTRECKKNGTIAFAHLARLAFISIAILKDAIQNKIISKKGVDQFLNSLNTINKIMTNDAIKLRKKKIKQKIFYEKYYHLRPGTYDISSDNYGEKNFKILKDIVKSSKKIKKTKLDLWNKEKISLFNYLKKKQIINFENPNQFEIFLRVSIEQRELSKFYFTRYVNKILETIKKIALQNKILNNDVNFLNIKEIVNIKKKNLDVIKKKIDLRKNKYEINKKFDLPQILTNRKEFINFEQLKGIPNFIGTKKIEKKIKFIDNYKLDNFSLRNKIALIESADPGYDWIFSKKIAGLVTMFGGANSHMAIRSSELNLPAAIGIGTLKFKELKKATLIKLDANNKILEVIK